MRGTTGDSVIGCDRTGLCGARGGFLGLQRSNALAGVLAGVIAMLATPAMAQTSFSYWVSMRGVAAETQPSFVVLSAVPTATQTVAFPGCHGRTWYLEAAAAASVQAARAVGETVQIHRGPPGSSPSGSTVICLIQADG
jgi:hypothetical protein